MEPTIVEMRHELAATVRELMGRHRTSQTALAEVLGMSQAAVSRRVVGETAFNLDELVLIAEHYNVPITELVMSVDELRRRQRVEQGLPPTKWYIAPVQELPGQISLDEFVEAA